MYPTSHCVSFPCNAPTTPQPAPGGLQEEEREGKLRCTSRSRTLDFVEFNSVCDFWLNFVVPTQVVIVENKVADQMAGKVLEQKDTYFVVPVSFLEAKSCFFKCILLDAKVE